MAAVCLITTGNASPENFAVERSEILATIKLAVEEGVSLIQIREKQLPARLLYELARDAAAITSGRSVKLLINDRADIAVAAGANSVHLPANSLPVRIVRQNFPDKFIVVCFKRTALEEILSAKADGADYGLFAPVFSTPGKGEPKGLDELKHVCVEAGSFPVIALGGIDDANFESVLAVGAAGFAAIRSLNDAESRNRILDRLRTKQPLV